MKSSFGSKMMPYSYFYDKYLQSYGFIVKVCNRGFSLAGCRVNFQFLYRIYITNVFIYFFLILLNVTYIFNVYVYMKN